MFVCFVVFSDKGSALTANLTIVLFALIVLHLCFHMYLFAAIMLLFVPIAFTSLLHAQWNMYALRYMSVKIIYICHLYHLILLFFVLHFVIWFTYYM